MEIHKKSWKKYFKKQCYRAKTILLPAHSRKWASLADVFWYTHFQQYKVDETIKCLLHIQLKLFEMVIGILRPPGGPGQTPKNAHLGSFGGSAQKPLKGPQTPLPS